MEKQRCAWVTKDPLYEIYHDEEWGNMERFFNDAYLFEMITLEGAQAGLSWITILKRRENYRKAFAHFDIATVATYTEEDVNKLLKNEGIIRNERKIRATIQNAQAILYIQEEFGSFHQYIWTFVGEKSIVNDWKDSSKVPASSTLSTKLSKDLKKRGFSFVGPVICYSFLQAVGIIQDHTKQCFLYKKQGEN